MAGGPSEAYQQIERKIAEDRCVILDGGGATELQRLGLKDFRLSDDSLWGTWALYRAPYAALDVHRRYLAAGCDVVSTHTWAIMSAPEMESRGMFGGTSHWMDVSRLGIRLARQAIAEAGKTGECIVAFSLNGDVEKPEQQATLQLLARVFEEEPPDLLAEFPALSPRRVRRLRSTLGWAGGRSFWAGRPQI